MQHPVFYLLRPPLIPELCSDIAAGSSCDIHLILVTVAAVRALPHQLSLRIGDNLYLTVVATFLTIVALGIQLCIHDILIYILHDREHGIQIVLHIRHLDIADGAARRKLLKLRFKLQLLECVYLLGHMYMIAVRNVALIRDTRYDAKAFL